VDPKYQIKLRGFWTPYTPATLPDGFTSNSLFLQDEAGQDWFAMLEDETGGAISHTTDVLYATALKTPGGNVVQAVVRDLTMVIPTNSYFFEIAGVDPAEPKPWKLFEQQLFDPEALTITPRPPRPVVVSKLDLYRRVTDGEAADIEAELAKQPIKNRRLFDAAMTFQSDAPEWALLRQIAGKLFGDDRAAELLTPTIPWPDQQRMGA
jgi:hypothetical protein